MAVKSPLNWKLCKMLNIQPKKMTAFIMLVLLLVSAPAIGETIKILIIDGHFKDIPEREEQLAKLDSIDGELVIGGAKYKGNIEVWRGDRGLYLISKMPLEDYIKGVVMSEIGDDWDMEALKVQAVIARTYALYQKKKSKEKKFDITSDTSHQVFKGNPGDTRIAYAVKHTAGEILTYDGKPIEAFYHSTCGGHTESPEEAFGKKHPYLKPVKTPCNLSPYQNWTRNISYSAIEDATGINGVKEIQAKSKTMTGRVKEVVITGSSSRVTMEATELRRKLGWKKLPSTDFKMKPNGNSVTFEGKGFGHGVGLCQFGSLEMAKKGKSYKEILATYFPGATIELYDSSRL